MHYFESAGLCPLLQSSAAENIISIELSDAKAGAHSPSLKFVWARIVARGWFKNVA